VDLHRVTGSGPNGVIRHHDVRAFAASIATTSAPAVAAPPAPTYAAALQVAAELQTPPPGLYATIDLTSLQRVTGQRMLESVQTAPQFAVEIHVDMTAMLALRHSHAQTGGETPSITACLVRAAAAALKRHPRLNSSFVDGHLQLHPQVNIGVAIGTPDGLIVPVIHNAGALDLAEIAARIRAAQVKAEKMRFAPQDLSDGTFTISNLGMFGVERFNAILNPPQSAILAVGRTVKAPVVLPDDTIVVRPRAALTLTVDHRAVDGLQAALFLTELCKLIEDPTLLI
jgi:pyruvate dehydrogenase E2 component (dihydrolipoamide acetyltransferase)